ncbi:isoprenylcysteine carboxylmethyltransferase family protein [Patescibacteria group bacterium]|nr:isoprenylcysteine carboxylmethyltransferase family protein [Patescibacteria group bacterium]
MKIPIPPITFIISFILSLILYEFFPTFHIKSIDILSIALIIIGILFVVIAFISIKRHKTSIDPNDIPSVLIKSGIFSLSRNPIYLGMLIILFGLDFYFFSVLSFLNIVIYFIILNYYVIPKEERNIESRFDSAYLEYKRKVRKWI